MEKQEKQCYSKRHSLEQLMIKLELDVNEVNGVLAALGQMPYVHVSELILKIRTQAAPQVAGKEEDEATQTWTEVTNGS